MKPLFVFAVFLAFTLTASAEEICQTAECKALSEDLLHHSLNESAAPCNSFFDYVCGQWPASHPLPAANGSRRAINYFSLRQSLVLEEIDAALLSALNSSNVAIRSVGQIYSDCLDSATIERRGVGPLVEAIQRSLGDWPLLQRKHTENSNTTKPTPHWQDLYVNAYAHTGIVAAFNLSTLFNFDLGKSIAYVTSGVISNAPTSAFLTERTHFEEYRAFLHQLLTTFFAIPEGDRLKADIEAVLHLEQKLTTAYLEAFTLHKGKDIFFGSYADLEVALKGKVDWRSMLNELLGRLSLVTKVPLVTPTDKVHARMLPYLVEATTILETTPISVVRNWLGLMMTFQLKELSTDALQRAIAAFTGDHTYDQKARKAFCSDFPTHWPAVHSRIYIDSHFSAQKKTEAKMMVRSLRVAFAQDLANHTEWLDEKTKRAALEKLAAIKQVVGYEDWIIDDQALTADYPRLNNETIVRGRFFESALPLRVDYRRNILGFMHPDTPVIPYPEQAAHDPTLVNAFYGLTANSITIPAAILQAPFFDDHQRPYAMNYGAIGSVVGHELTHAFDNRGARFDKEGKLRNWWSRETRAKFSEKSACFAEQYGALREPLTGKMVDGQNTLGENIADNGGVRRAWDAYREHQKATGKPSPVLPNLKLTADQLFFVAYAHSWCENVTPEFEAKALKDVHSPSRFRVDTVLGNTPAFATAFQCPLGSKMNPVKKCSVW